MGEIRDQLEEEHYRQIGEDYRLTEAGRRRSMSRAQRKPWLLEMEAAGKWFLVERFYSYEKAQARMVVAKRDAKSEFRVRNETSVPTEFSASVRDAVPAFRPL